MFFMKCKLKLLQILHLILISIIFSNCNLDQKKGETISIKKNNYRPFNIMIDSIIPLETNNRCILADIGHLEYHNNQFFFWDPIIAKNIYTFDRSGKFLYKLIKGKGPGEYANIKNFALTDSTLVVHNFSKLIYYNLDGNYLYDWIIPKELVFSRYIYFKESIITYGHSPTRNALQNFTGNNFIGFVYDNMILYKVYDTDFEIEIDTFLPFRRDYYSLNTESPFCQYDDHVLLISPITNDIYTYDGKDFRIAYSIDFGKKNFKDKEINLGVKNYFDRIGKEEKWGDMDYINETEEFISFGFLRKVGQITFCVVSKSSKKYAFFDDLFEEKNLNDVLVLNTFGNQFMCVVYPEKLGAQRRDLLTKRYSSQNPLTENSNPVIIFVTVTE